MLEIFRRNLFFNSLLILPYICILRIKSLVSPEVYQVHAEDGYLNHLIFGVLSDYALVQSMIAILLVFFQATFVNYIFNKNRLASIPNLLPGLVYALLVSSLSAFQVLNPALIAITFLLFSINSLFKCANKFPNARHIFNVSFFISLASLFYFPFWIFLIAGYISLLTVRSFKVQERMQYAVSALIPYFLFSTYYNWNDVLNKYLTKYFSENVTIASFKQGFDNYQIIVLSVFIFFALFSFFKYNDYKKKKNVAAQKKIDILYWFLLFTIPTILFWKNLELNHLLVLFPSLSIMLGMFLFRLKNKLLAEVIHLTAVLVIFFVQFQY